MAERPIVQDFRYGSDESDRACGRRLAPACVGPLCGGQMPGRGCDDEPGHYAVELERNDPQILQGCVARRGDRSSARPSDRALQDSGYRCPGLGEVRKRTQVIELLS